MLGEIWKDSLGAVWVCVTTRTPGTWRQVTPAAALGDKTEELASDLRNLSILIHALRTALVGVGLIRGGA